MKQFEKVLILINSEGKKKNIADFLVFLHEYFQEELDNGSFILSKTVDSMSTKLISKDFSDKYSNSLIIAVGGDGTIHEIINSIDFDKISLAIIPNGTGNDFASHLYGNFKLEDIYDKLLDPKFLKSDLIKINQYYCMNTISFGYDTVVLRKSLEIKNRWSFLRNISFKLAIPLTLNYINPVNYSYEFVDYKNEVIKGTGNFILNAICNGSRFGGGFRPAPDAIISDGIIELNQVDEMSLFSLIKKIPSYLDGSHIDKVKESHNCRVKSGTIIPIKGLIYGNIDGELYEFEKINFEIVPKRINLMF